MDNQKQIVELVKELDQLKKEREELKAIAEREHQKRLLCLRKLLVDELARGK